MAAVRVVVVAFVLEGEGGKRGEGAAAAAYVRSLISFSCNCCCCWWWLVLLLLLFLLMLLCCDRLIWAVWQLIVEGVATGFWVWPLSFLVWPLNLERWDRQNFLCDRWCVPSFFVVWLRGECVSFNFRRRDRYGVPQVCSRRCFWRCDQVNGQKRQTRCLCRTNKCHTLWKREGRGARGHHFLSGHLHLSHPPLSHKEWPCSLPVCVRTDFWDWSKLSRSERHAFTVSVRIVNGNLANMLPFFGHTTWDVCSPEDMCVSAWQMCRVSQRQSDQSCAS